MTIRRLIGLLFLALSANMARAQANLHLVPTGDSIDHKFEIRINAFIHDKILEISGLKMNVRPDEIWFNGQPLKVKSCKTRGNTTLEFRRKSFSISLKDPIDFQGVPVKRLAVNNLAMDKNYWRARLCFLLMHRMGIFPLKNQYTELVINDETQGTYLMIQKPEDYCRQIGSKLLTRREGIRQISVEYAHDADAKKSVKQLKKVKDLPKQFSGEQLFDTLGNVVDFKSYSKWLAFNYLILNGDYTDELFLYLHPETNRFDILPWDYDDVFAAQPHEGLKQRDHLLGDQLLFSSEAPLDLIVARDKYLYQQYLDNFTEVVAVITPEVIRSTFEQVYRELISFFSQPEVIAQSQYDEAGLTNIDLLQEDLETHYQFLLNRRNSIDAALKINSK